MFTSRTRAASCARPPRASPRGSKSSSRSRGAASQVASSLGHHARARRALLHRGKVPKPTILAVDDTPSNLVALEAVLDADYELRFARSGTEAINSLAENPDVAV